ncbi:MAG: hypothetical protein FJW35_10195 [Acidobacteria bacterium]|nr:hypothetical protein [Acidobacteriota bacterium]
MFLNDEDKKAIAETVREAEARTSGEIVFAVTDASGSYRHAALQGALAATAVITAVFLLLPLTHTIGLVLWTELVAFGFFYALAPWLPIRRWFTRSQEMEGRVQEAAFREFYSSGLFRTREANGVLIYLSLFERRVVVLGDRGIHERMGAPHWNDVRDRIIQGVRQGQARKGICAAIAACGKALETHFPRPADDTNELPNQVIDRTGP